MSIKIVSAVFEHYPEGGGEMLLALAMADHAHDDGSSITASVDHYADKTRQSPRTVQYQLRKMQRVRWLIKVSSGRGGRPRSDGFVRNQTSHYRINPRWLAAATVADSRARVPFDVCSEAEEGQEKWVQKLHPFVDNSTEMGATHDRNGCNPRQELVQQLLHPNRQDNHQENQTSAREPSVVDNFASDQPGQSDSDRLARCRELFEVFWQAYPRREARDDAWRAFSRLNPDLQLMDWICKAIVAQRASDGWQRDGGRWIPFAGNWLKGRRWRDSPGAGVDQGGHRAQSQAAAVPAPVQLAAGDKASGLACIAELKKIIPGA